MLMSLLRQIVRKSDSDCVTVIGAGVTLHEALAAADMLASEGKLTLPSTGYMYVLRPTFHDYHPQLMFGHSGVISSSVPIMA